MPVFRPCAQKRPSANEKVGRFAFGVRDGLERGHLRGVHAIDGRADALELVDVNQVVAHERPHVPRQLHARVDGDFRQEGADVVVVGADVRALGQHAAWHGERRSRRAGSSWIPAMCIVSSSSPTANFAFTLRKKSAVGGLRVQADLRPVKAVMQPERILVVETHGAGDGADGLPGHVEVLVELHGAEADEGTPCGR